MEADVLNLLPPRGLDQSILLAVLIGLYILLFFTECFGWVFAGMVVPGYLASVFIMSLGAGIAVTFEAIVTIIVAKGVTKFVSKTEAGTQFFGRERFFLIVLVSVVVRQNSEIWLLPAVAPWVDAWFETTLAAERGLASIGLVLVPLTANMFWKLSIPRGVVQIGVPVAFVYILLVWVLLPYTNLSYSTLELTYENAALDFLASPKAYLILLVGAYLASRFNLNYGWDYNGILVPALLSLTWMDPIRILTTVIEALLLLYATIGFLKLPPVRTLNFEGPRKVVLVFTIGFVIKYAFSWWIGDRLPTQRVTDLFGFGYILPSLLAVKMLQKKTVGRILLPALQTSLLAFLLANLLGMGLQLLDSEKTSTVVVDARDSTSTQILTREPLGAALTAKTRARLDVARLEPLQRSRDQLLAYRKLWKKLGRALRLNEKLVTYQRENIEKLGLELRDIYDRDGGDAFLMLEKQESMLKQKGWDTSLLYPGQPGPVIAVPRPHSDAYAAVAATYICRKIRCRAIIFSGVDTSLANAREGDALANKRSSFHFAHRGLGNSTPILQLRVYGDADTDTSDEIPTLYLKGRLSSDLNLDALWPDPIDMQWKRPPGAHNAQWDTLDNLAVFRVPYQRMEDQLLLCTRVLYSKGGTTLGAWLSERFDQPRVQDAVHGTSSAPCGWIAQDTATATESLPDDFDTGYDDDFASSLDDSFEQQTPLTTLLLEQGAALPELLKLTAEPFTGRHDESLCSAGSEFGAWMERQQPSEDVPPIVSEQLSETELAFMRLHLVAPLLKNIQEGTDAAHARIHWLSKLAYQIGYEIGQFDDCGEGGQPCWVLAQHPDSDVQSSIVMIIREGEAAPIAVEVPKPDLEPGTWRLGLELWRYNKARILLMGVPINERSPSRARELRRKRNAMFHALHTTLDHILAVEGRGLIMQVRGYSSWRTLKEPLVIGIGRPILPWSNTPWGTFAPTQENTPVLRAVPSFDSDRSTVDLDSLHLPPYLRPMLSEEQDGVLLSFGDIRFSDGAEDAIGLRGRRNRQLAYTRLIGETEMALLLFSQNARDRYRRFGNDHQCRLMRRAGLTPAGEGAYDGAPRQFLLQPQLDISSVGGEGLLPRELSELLDLMRRAAAFENPYLLEKLASLDERDDRIDVSAGTDAEFGRPFLTLEFRLAKEVYRAVVFIGEFLQQPATIAIDIENAEKRVIQAISRRSSPIVVHGTPIKPEATRPRIDIDLDDDGDNDGDRGDNDGDNDNDGDRGDNKDGEAAL